MGSWREARRRRLVLLVLAALLIAPAGLLLWTQPALAAFACPRCFGFEPLAPRLYVEGDMPANRKAALVEAVRAGDARIDAFYGGAARKPTILACATEFCSRRLGGGGALGVSYATFGLRLSPLGLDPAIVAHERSHIELHGRIGVARWLAGAVPTWFDEGLAVLVAEDRRYLKPEGAGDRCRAEPGAALPASAREWMRAASADHDLYAQAACRVSRWMAAHGGREGILNFLDRIAAGADFAQALGEKRGD